MQNQATTHAVTTTENANQNLGSTGQSPPPVPHSVYSESNATASSIQQANETKFTGLRLFLIFHFLMTLFFCLGHIFKGLPQTLAGGYSLRDLNLEFVRIITSAAHLACIAGIYRLKSWGWTGYKIVWGISLALHLMLVSLDLIFLILFASVFTGIIHVLLKSGEPNSAMKLLK